MHLSFILSYENKPSCYRNFNRPLGVPADWPDGEGASATDPSSSWPSEVVHDEPQHLTVNHLRLVVTVLKTLTSVLATLLVVLEKQKRFSPRSHPRIAWVRSHWHRPICVTPYTQHYNICVTGTKKVYGRSPAHDHSVQPDHQNGSSHTCSLDCLQVGGVESRQKGWDWVL